MTVITVLSAGLRAPSSTRNLADQLAAATRTVFETTDETADAPVDVRVIEVREHAHAVADALLSGFPVGSLRTALDDVAAADALIVVTPTFQGSYGGLFKSFADLLEADTVRGTPVLLAATGGSERHSLVIEHALRPLFSYLGALTVPTGVYAATSDFGGPGAAALSERIQRATAELAELAGLAGVGETAAAAIASSAAVSGGLAASAGAAEVTPFEELLARTRR